MPDLPASLRQKLTKIASLLDDSDETVAARAIAALLEHEEELGDLPSQLQEDADPLVRKRAHQLQAAMLFRKHRRVFAQLLQEENPDFRTGAALLHLLWFDKDNQVDVYSVIDDFAADLRRHKFNTLSEIGFYMRKAGFHAVPESQTLPETYCIGTVLDERSGSGIMLAAMIAGLLKLPGLQVVRHNGKFGLYWGNDELLCGLDNWRISPVSPAEQLEVWNNRMILRFCGSMLFSGAVYSDSFRYILTIAQALSGDTGDTIMSELPYPYCGESAL